MAVYLRELQLVLIAIIIPNVSWLLNDPNMKIRSVYEPYQEAVVRFFHKLFEILTPLQVHKLFYLTQVSLSLSLSPSSLHMVAPL